MSIRLERDEVHLWRASMRPPPTLASDLALLLSREEHDRASHFRRDSDRESYVAAHAMLRLVLSRFVSAPSASLAFGTGKHGKPTLEQGAGLSFNLTHSGEIALLAISDGRAVGVDVEEIRDSIDAPGIARAVFSEPELELLSEASPHEQDRFFYRTWVRKEAVLKACALGLTVEPRDLSVWADAVNAEGTAWDVREVEVGDRYAAAVAAPGKDWSLRCFEYSWMAVTSPQGLSSQEIPG